MWDTQCPSMSWSHSQLEKWDGVTQKHNKPYRFWAFSPRGAEVAGCTCFAVRCRNLGLLSGGCVCSAQSHVAPLQSGCDTVISSEGEQEPKISARSFPQNCFLRASFSLSLQRELSTFIASLGSLSCSEAVPGPFLAGCEQGQLCHSLSLGWRGHGSGPVPRVPVQAAQQSGLTEASLLFLGR